MKPMLDTNICIYIIKNKPISVKKKLTQWKPSEISISSISVCELYYGAYKSQFVEKNLSALSSFLEPFNIVEYDEKASIEYGKIRAKLETKGTIIGGMDMLIASHTISLGMTLITNNIREFQRVENLKIENWV